MPKRTAVHFEDNTSGKRRNIAVEAVEGYKDIDKIVELLIRVELFFKTFFHKHHQLINKKYFIFMNLAAVCS